MLTVAVLGPTEVHCDGVRVPLPAGKTTELLARLAIDVGIRIRADVLLEDLWGAPTARNTLQSKVSQLRRALGKDLVVGSDDGYLLDLPRLAVDATEVIELAARSAAARAAGDLPACLDWAGSGLARFRGEPLIGAGAWAVAHQLRLAEVRLGMLEDAAAARVGLGAGADIVAELQQQTRAHPLREGLWAALITALYRAGRQAEALAAYRQVRQRLNDELGLDPGPVLQELEVDVLRQSADLTTTLPPRAQPGNLPAPTDKTVGRDDDVAAILADLENHRLVTVLGAGGVGKTRVGLLVGDRLRSVPGGVWLVRLDAADSSVPIWQLVAETLHLPAEPAALRDRLDGADTVVVLDNCEHRVAETAALLTSLLGQVPRLRVLATSQVPLGLAGESRYQLDPLSQADSVELFVDRARQARRRLVLDEEATATVDVVCRSLDGLPLAIELAAARVRSLSVRDIAARLDDRFALLADPSSSEPRRRSTLVGAIGWSYDLLFPDGQRALWALSCFAGSAALDAILHVLGTLEVPAESAVDTIGRLVDRSLITVDSAAGGAVRYRLLDSIRAYATDRLAESGHENRARAAWVQWYAQLAAWCDEHVRSEHQPDCVAIVRSERTDIDAVLSWCGAHAADLGTRIANDFGWTWVVVGEGTAAAARVRNARSDLAPPRERIRSGLLASWLEASAGDVTLAAVDLDRARALAEQESDELLRADVDRHQAFLAIQQGNADLVIAASAVSRDVYRRHRLDWPTAASLLLGAYGSIMRGDSDTASRDANEALALLDRLGDAWGLVHGQAILGAIAQAEHRFADAARSLELAADTSARSGFIGQAALHRTTLARVRQRAERDGSQTSFRQAIDEAISVGDGRLAAGARVNLARLCRSTGDDDEAMALLAENDRWYRTAGGGDFAQLNLALLAAIRSDRAELESMLRRARTTENVEVIVHCLDALARLAATADDRATARRLLGEADDQARRVAHLLDDDDRVDALQARSLLAS